MNLGDYFDPIDFSTITRGINPLGKYSLLNTAGNNYSTALNKEEPAVAVVGIPEVNGKRQKKELCSPDLIRTYFYRLASIGNGLRIIDLGNLKPSKSHKGTMLALRDVSEYLHQHNITTIAIGGSQELTAGLAEAFSNERFLWLSVIDAVLDVKKGREAFNSTNYLTQLLKKQPHIFQFSLIAYQQHLTSGQLLAKTTDFGSHLRLGELRENPEQAELLLRNTNILSFDMGAIKHHDAPGTPQRNPNGLRGEEACQLAYYAGLNPRLYAFGIFEMFASADDDLTPALAAEIIWYFVKGVSLRNYAPLKTAYKVEVEGIDQPIMFRHDRELNQWWYELKTWSDESIEIACSAKEYRQAAANEIPDRWLRFLQKLDRLPK